MDAHSDHGLGKLDDVPENEMGFGENVKNIN